MHRIPSREVFVAHCSSAVYQPHFQAFLRNDLLLDHYALIALPGGVQALTLENFLPKFSWAGWRWIKFLMDLDSPSRIILIGHDDCRWYHRGPIGQLLGPERARQEKDLRAVAQDWKKRFPDCSVSAFYATLTAGKATFDAVR
jgi:hypothetical protein